MLFEECFLIQPQRRLQDVLDRYSTEYDPEIVEELREPSCWISTLSDWVLRSDEQIRVKLLFIASKYEEGVDSHHEGYRKLIKELFGEPPLQESTFDKWWTIEHLLHSPILYDKIEQVIARDSFKFIGKTGNARVDSWLEANLENGDANK